MDSDFSPTPHAPTLDNDGSSSSSKAKSSKSGTGSNSSSSSDSDWIPAWQKLLFLLNHFDTGHENSVTLMAHSAVDVTERYLYRCSWRVLGRSPRPPQVQPPTPPTPPKTHTSCRCCCLRCCCRCCGCYCRCCCRWLLPLLLSLLLSHTPYWAKR